MRIILIVIYFGRSSANEDNDNTSTLGNDVSIIDEGD